MEISDLQSKSIGILGFGQEGSAIAKYLLDNLIKPNIFDKQEQSNLPKMYQDQLTKQKLDYFSGEDYFAEAIKSCQIIFRSPGVKLTKEQFSKAQEAGVIITSQAQWFFEHCPAKIIGITGTKGKGTTSSLIYEILQAANLDNKVFLTGNIGKIQPLEILSQISQNDLVVYELSSFQLEFLEQSPHIGVCLMVTEDHLDYHDDIEDYVSAKQAINKFQSSLDHSVANIDYIASRTIGNLGQGKKWQISKEVDLLNGAKILNNSIQFYVDGKANSSFSTTDLLLRGKHNLENIAAGITVAKILGIEDEVIQHSINNFKGLEHRLQLVKEHNGARYYNDSISTIPETTIAAVKSFSEPVILLIGGATKNLNYSELIEYLVTSQNIKAIICIGQTGQQLYEQLSETALASKLSGPFNDFQAAVKEGISQAQSGDIVLLSPAATSFDMFENYKQRGDKFVEIVSNFN